MTQLIPQAGRRSRFVLEWTPEHCLERVEHDLDALTGQSATFTRTAATTATDAVGNTIKVAHSQAAWEWKDLLADGVQKPGLLLSTSDRLYLGYQGKPTARTFYVFLTDKTATGASNGSRIIEIGDSSSATGYLTLRRHSAGYDAVHHNGSASVTATVSVTVASGDRIELRLILASNGAITLAVTKNNGTETVESATSSNTLGAAWNQPRLAIGADYSGGNRATQVIHRIRDGFGTLTLAQLRTA